MKNPIRIFAIACGLACGALSAEASTITFNSSNGLSASAGQTQTIEGFDFTAMNTGSFYVVTSQAGLNHDGTPELFSANHTPLEMVENGGGSFSLPGFDLSGSWSNCCSNR